VVFDFGNVLYEVDYTVLARAVAFERAGEFLGLFVGFPIQMAYETGGIPLNGVLEALKRRGFPVSRERFREGYLAVFCPVPGARGIIECLAEFLPLGLLSNTSPEHARFFIEKMPEFPLFDERVYSFETGWMKPDRRIYGEIARRLRLPPEELAYTDDVEEFVRAAREVGMGGVTFRSAESLRLELLRVGFPELTGLASGRGPLETGPSPGG
jgi:FMN phosphatase YigB (HAD superfamily)